MNWIKYVKDWQATGSKYICDGLGVIPEDEDYVALGGFFTNWGLKRLGFYQLAGGAQNTYSGMSLVTVYRKGNVDIVVCWSRSTYTRFVVATQICKYLRTRDKSTRCNIHSVALYGHPMK